MNEKKGNIFIFLGALFWSLNAPIVKGVDLPPLFISCYRSLIAGLVLLPFLKPKQIKESLNIYLIMFLLSYLGLCASITVAIKNTSPTIAIGMQYASILWIFCLNFFILNKKEHEKIPSIVLIFIGVVLFMTSNTTKGSSFGNLLAFFESIFFTLMTISSNKLKNINPLGLTALANIFTGIILFFIIGTDKALILNLQSNELIAVVLLGCVQVALGYGCYNIGLKYTSSQNASLIAICEMILGPLWVFLFLHEGSNTQTLIGFAFIIVGLVSSYFFTRRKESKLQKALVEKEAVKNEALYN